MDKRILERSKADTGTRTLLIESDLLASVLTNTATVSGSGVSAGSSETAATTAETTTTTATAATATTTGTTTATTTTVTAVTASTSIAGDRVVETDVPASDISAVHSLEGSTGFIDRGELDVAEALGAAGLLVGGQADGHDGAVLGEGLADHVLVSAEGDVADEESVGLGGLGVAEVLGALLDTLVVVAGRARLGEVDVDVAAVDLGTLLSSKSLGSILGGGEVNVAVTVES